MWPVQRDVSVGSRFASLLAQDFAIVDKIFVSFDLDSVQASDAPVRCLIIIPILLLLFTYCDCYQLQGVSAVGVVGISSQDALDICLEAGRNPKVRCNPRSSICSSAFSVCVSFIFVFQVQLFDLSEYNPTVEDWRTGKLVANMFYYFCLGVAQRQQFNK